MEFVIDTLQRLSTYPHESDADPLDLDLRPPVPPRSEGNGSCCVAIPEIATNDKLVVHASAVSADPTILAPPDPDLTRFDRLVIDATIFTPSAIIEQTPL